MGEAAGAHVLSALPRVAGHRASARALGDIVGTLNYSELDDRIRRRARALRAAGAQPGERVVIAAANSVDQVVTHLAVLWLGGVSVPVEGSTPDERLRFIMTDCEPKLICVESEARVASLRESFTTQVCSIGQLRAAAASATPLDLAAVKPEAPCCLMYTTGSTNAPKGVVLTHRSLSAALSHISEYLACGEGDVEAIVLPLSHSFGLGHVYCTLLTGGFAWVHDGLRPVAALFNALSELQINAMPATPSMLRLLLGPYRKQFISRADGLRRIVINSEMLPPAEAKVLLESLPASQPVVYYGLTEASRSTFLRLRDVSEGLLTTVGRHAPRVQISIRNEHGEEQGTGREGEVWIAGPHLATGYWRRPEETERAFQNGWLRSGDLGRLDAEGFLTLVGRSADVINVGGLKIPASSVEAVVNTIASVSASAATAVRDPAGMRGEVVGVLVASEDPSLDAQEIMRVCSAALDSAFQPQLIAIVREIPRSPTGKVLKGEVKRILESQAS
jgi:long-chain acyl-CoA synthetase